MFVVTNISQAAMGGLEDLAGAYKRNQMFLSGSVMHKFWFSCFMVGIHK
jgi:hypothetical protein